MRSALTPARRLALAGMSTVSVVALLFGYHTSTAGALASASAVGTVSPASSSGGVTTSGNSSSGNSSSTGESSSSGTVAGGVARTQWGPVQVQLTVDSGTITAVDVLQYPHGNPRDAQINSYALPILVQETLDAQSAQIDMISGATVTSVGYTQSLQSALDQAGL